MHRINAPVGYICGRSEERTNRRTRGDRVRLRAAGAAQLVNSGAAEAGAGSSKLAGRALYKNEASASGIREVQLKPGADDKAGIVVGANLGGPHDAACRPRQCTVRNRCDFQHEGPSVRS